MQAEGLYERYRSTGDAEALGAVFDAVAPELLPLAVRLAPSVAEAEDLVQGAFLALLERPKAFRRGARLAPFLVGILVRQASAARRRARRRPDVSRLAERAAPEDPAHATERAELDSALRAALDDVPEAYREVLRLHLLEGRRSIEIALRLGQLPGTVAKQLVRGLEHLRRALPRGLVAGGAASLAGTRGEAAMRAWIVAEAQRLAPVPLAASPAGSPAGSSASISADPTAQLIPAAPLAGAASVSLFALIMKPLIVLGAALLALSAWFTLVRTPAPAPLEGDRSRVGVAGDGEARGEPDLAAPVAPRPAAVEARTSATPVVAPRPSPTVPRELRVELRGVRPGDLPGYTVSAQAGASEVVVAKVGADGVALLDLAALLPPQAMDALHVAVAEARVEVSATHALYLDSHASLKASAVEAGEVCVLEPRLASIVGGRVIAPPGVAAEDVQIGLFDERGAAIGWFGPDGGWRADADGRYRVKVTVEGVHRLAFSSPRARPAEVWCRLTLGEQLELPDLELSGGGASIDGRVDLPEGAKPSSGGLHVLASWRGAAAPSAERAVIDRDNASTFPTLRAVAPPQLQRAPITAEGTFELGGLEPGPWELEVHGVAAAALLPPRARAQVDAPARGVVLWRERCLLTVEAVTTGGEALARTQVTWSSAGPDGSSSFQQTFTDEDGRVTVVADATRDYDLHLSRDGQALASEPWPAAGRGRSDVRRVELRPPAQAELIVRLAPESVSVDAARLVLRADPAGPLPEARADRVGDLLRFTGLKPGRYVAELAPADLALPLPNVLVRAVTFEVDLQPGASVERAVTFEAGGALRVEFEDGAPAVWSRFELRDAAGRDVPFSGVVALESGDGFGSFHSRANQLHGGGPCGVREVLAPGAYTLVAVDGRWAVEPRLLEVVAGEVTRARVTWRGD